MTDTSHARTGILLSVLLAAAVLAVTPAAATPVRAPHAVPDLRELAGKVREAPLDPLALFHLELGISPERTSAVARLRAPERLAAGPTRYVHYALAPIQGGDTVLPAPGGITVLDGDLFFLRAGHHDQRLVEASLVLESPAGREAALDLLISHLGQPRFEVVMPGALHLVIGWRTERGYVLATFDDLPVFRLSVFADAEDDLLVGSQIVLWEGLADYAERLAAGEPSGELLRRLVNLVLWVGMARDSLEVVH